VEGDHGPRAEDEMARKRADYFAAGTLVVWDVDLVGADVVRVFRPASAEPSIYRRGDVAEAEPAVPGWRMKVDELFE
jgi:Uma2 family endonuclease